MEKHNETALLEARFWQVHHQFHELEPNTPEHIELTEQFRELKAQRDVKFLNVPYENAITASQYYLEAVLIHDNLEIDNRRLSLMPWTDARYALQGYYNALEQWDDSTCNIMAEYELLRWYAHSIKNYHWFTQLNHVLYSMQLGCEVSYESVSQLTLASKLHDIAERDMDKSLWELVIESMNNHYELLKESIHNRV